MQDDKKLMKKMIKNLIIFLILIISQNAFCYTLQSDDLHKIIYNRVNSETKKQLGNLEYKINIQMPAGDIITNDLEAPKIELPSCQEFTPVSFRRVTIKDSKGNIVKTLPVSVKISVYQEVLTATQPIAFNKSIDSSNSKTEKREVSKCLNNVLTSLPNNYVASKNIVKGGIIQKNSVKQKAIIEKNQNVDIVFQGKGVQITLRGKALKEGARGETILVRSEKYNKTYSAKVDSQSKVTVRI